MFSPSKPMRPPRPRPQDNNDGISYVQSHKCLSACKDSPGIRHFCSHIPKSINCIAPSYAQPEKDEQTLDSINHDPDINFCVCGSNYPMHMNSATATTSNDYVLQGHISTNQNLFHLAGDTCQHFMQIGNTKHRYNIDYTSRDGKIVPIRSITPNFNRHRSCTRNIPQANDLQPRGWFPPQLHSGKMENLCQAETVLDRHIGPTQLRHQRALSVLSTTRVAECDNACHEYGRDYYLSKEHFLLPQVHSSLNCQRETITAENLKGNFKESRQRDCHDANTLSTKKAVDKLSSGEEIKVSQKRYHYDHRLPIALDACAKIQDQSGSMLGEAIDTNVKEKIVRNEEIFKTIHAPVHQYTSGTVFPQNTLSRMHSSQFSIQSSHSSVQFDNNFVSILRIMRITPLPSRAKLQMSSLPVSVSYIQSDLQEHENIMKRPYCAFSDDYSASYIADKFFQHNGSSLHNSLKSDRVQMRSTKECTALSHMSVGSGYKLSSDTPLSLPHSIISSMLALPDSSQRSIEHSQNNNFCNQSEYSLLTSSTPYHVNCRQDNSMNRKRSLLSNTSILEATSQAVFEMIATSTCYKAPDNEHLTVEITPEVAGHEIVSKEMSLKSLPQLPIMVTQRDKHALTFTPNSNAFSSKKSLGTFDGLTRPTATTPEESSEMELYGSERIFGIDFSHSPTTVSINPNYF